MVRISLENDMTMICKWNDITKKCLRNCPDIGTMYIFIYIVI